LEQFGSVSRSQGLCDLTVREYRLDPKWLEPYIDPNEIADKLKRIDISQLDAENMKAVSQFLHEYDLRMSGQDPEREC
jgi:hypothetical protein